MVDACVWYTNVSYNVFNQGYGHVYSVQKKNGKDKNEVYALKEVAIDQSEMVNEIEKYEEEIRNERKVMIIICIWNF